MCQSVIDGLDSLLLRWNPEARDVSPSGPRYPCLARARRQGNVSPSTGRYFLRLIIVLCQVPSWSRIVFQLTGCACVNKNLA